MGWLNRNADAITAIAAVVGLFVASGGFYFTVKELERTQTALKASNTYTIQKDVRELATSLGRDETLLAHINKTRQLAPDEVKQAERSMAAVFNFYLSVYRQQKAAGISEALQESMRKDFSRFFRNDNVKAFYDKMVAAGIYDDEIKAMVREWASQPRTSFFSVDTGFFVALAGD